MPALLPYAYGAELTVGLLAWLPFRYFRINSYWWFIFGGAAIGWLVAFAVSIVAGTPRATALNPLEAISYRSIVAAAASTTLFRFVAGRS